MSAPRLIRVISLARAGRVVPRRVRGMRAAVVELGPGAIMDWHSTGSREELLIVLRGRVRIHTAKAQRKDAKVATVMLRVDQCAFLARGTPHCVVNRSTGKARYLYVTA